MSAVLWGVRAVAKINLQRVFADMRIKNLVPRYRVKWFESFDKSYLNASEFVNDFETPEDVNLTRTEEIFLSSVAPFSVG